MEWYKTQLESSDPTVEKWPSDNTYVNHWKVDTTMLFAPGRVQKVSASEIYACPSFVCGANALFGVRPPPPGPHRRAEALAATNRQHAPGRTVRARY